MDADLLALLRCPHCAATATRAPGADPGRLQLVVGAWLVCQEPGCRRKYPIHEEIPDMRPETGEKWRETTAENLPAPG
jgi:uncharacterized protein YbaR (Trm112 family)